jgi:hypothetical protein
MLAPETESRDVRVAEVGTLTGLEVSNINPAVQSEMRLPIGSDGVVITRVPRHLRSIGLAPGDVIREINGNPMETTKDVIRASEEDTRRWQIIGERGGRIFNYRFRM